MTPLQYFRIFATEYAAVLDATVNQWLDIATAIVNTGCLDDERANMAISLYAAHMYSLSLRTSSSGTASGAITREKEGDLELQYAVSTASEGYLGQTTYGQQYKEMTAACFGAAIMTRGISSGQIY
jgi:hypothetical protein